MRVIVGGARPRPVISATIVLGSLAILVLPVVAGIPAEAVTLVAASLVLLVMTRRTAFQWRSLVGFLILVILFVPIRRYVLPGSLPFQLEPYRLFVALFVLFWISSLLIDRRVKLRGTGFEGPLFLFLGAVVCSIVANGSRIAGGHLESNVLKSLTFLLSFFAVLYIIASVIRRRVDVIFLLKLLVGGAAIIAVLAVIESRTGFNVFNHMQRLIPLLRRNFETELPSRYGRLRAYGPAEHAIALSAALAMMVPLAGYLALAQRKRRWWIAMGVIVLGCLATVSRTGVVMLAVEALVLVMLRPRQMRRLWPALIPLLVVMHLALPGTLGTLKESFFPKGGLAKEQIGSQGTGRLGSRLPFTFKQVDAHPITGIGYGTRIGLGPKWNAPILDDQWLGTLVETGILGVFAWIWLFVRLIRRLAHAARQEDGEDGWLFGALAASMAGFMVSMLTYDALSFTQVAFIFYILVGISAVLLRLRTARERVTVPATAAVQPAAAPAGGFGFALIGAALLLFDFTHGPNMKVFIAVLVMLAVGTWTVERGGAARRLAS